MSETHAHAPIPSQTHVSLTPMVLPQHGLTPYLRIRLEAADSVLRWDRPRTMLGIVPLVRRSTALQLDELRSMRLRQPVLRPLHLSAGLMLVTIPWFLLPWWAGIPLVALGLWVTLASLGPALDFESVGGRRHRVSVCFGHQFDAELFVEAVGRMVAPTSDPHPESALSGFVARTQDEEING